MQIDSAFDYWHAQYVDLGWLLDMLHPLYHSYPPVRPTSEGNLLREQSPDL